MVGKVKVLTFLLSVSTILAGISGGSYLASTALPPDTAADAALDYENTDAQPTNSLTATKVTSEAAADIAVKFLAAQSSSEESSEESSVPNTTLVKVNEEKVEEALSQDAASQDHSDDVLPNRDKAGGGDAGITKQEPENEDSGDEGIAPIPSGTPSTDSPAGPSDGSSAGGSTDSSSSSAGSASSGGSSTPGYSDGWQTIGGNTYYYKNGKPLTGWQVFDYGKPVTGSYNADGSIYYVEDMGSYRRYFFDANGVLSSGNGIDVSYAQGAGINWNQVKASGVDYAMIRCGYRGYETAALKEDSAYWVQNVRGAQAAGIKVGLYFFTNAINRQEAVDEAAYVLGLIEKYGLNITGPICIDMETICYRTMDNTTTQERTDIIRAFCDYISANGYKTQFYTNYDFAGNNLYISQLSDLSLWLASYNASSHFVFTNFVSKYGHRLDMWQYSSKNRIAGITGNVDMNVVLHW